MNNEVALHLARISSFTSAFDEAQGQLAKFQAAVAHQDIFRPSPDDIGVDTGACLRLIVAGAHARLIRLIMGDSTHKVVTALHNPVVRSLLSFLVSLDDHFQVQDNAVMASDLIRAAEVLVDRTSKHRDIVLHARRAIAFCVNTILALFVEGGVEIWGSKRARLEGISPRDVVALSLANLLSRWCNSTRAQHILCLGSLAVEHSFLLPYAFTSKANSITDQISVEAQVATMIWKPVHVGERVADFFRAAPLTGDPINTMTVAVWFLYTMMLNTGVHEVLIAKQTILQKMMQSLWTIEEEAEGMPPLAPNHRKILSGDIMEGIGKLLPIVKRDDLLVSTGLQLLRHDILSLLGISFIFHLKVLTKGEGFKRQLQELCMVFKKAVTNDPTLLNTVQPEWYHIWNRLRKLADVDPTGAYRDAMRVWEVVGRSLNVTPENCRSDLVRLHDEGGCNWYQCPLYGSSETAIVTVEMFRCKGCQMVFYCSTVCQRRDWRDGGHAESCRAHWTAL